MHYKVNLQYKAFIGISIIKSIKMKENLTNFLLEQETVYLTPDVL